MPDTKRGIAAEERREIVRAALIGAACAAVLVGALALAGRATLSDGLISRYIAAHLTIHPADVHPVVSSRGTSLRYGRIMLSALIWLFSGGRSTAMPWAQGAIMVASAGAACGAARALLPERPFFTSLAPFAGLGFTLSVAAGFQDALAVALGLWAVVAATRSRWWISSAVLAAAILTRENTGAVLVGLCAWLILERRWKPVSILALSVVPAIGWGLFVASRYGYFPLLDPYLRVATTTIRPPFVAVWESLSKSSAQAAFVAGLHLVLAIAALRLWRTSILGAVAAASALQVFSAGPFAWHFTGEAVRAFALLQVFLVLVLIDRRPATTARRITSGRTK